MMAPRSSRLPRRLGPQDSIRAERRYWLASLPEVVVKHRDATAEHAVVRLPDIGPNRLDHDQLWLRALQLANHFTLDWCRCLQPRIEFVPLCGRFPVHGEVEQYVVDKNLVVPRKTDEHLVIGASELLDIGDGLRGRFICLEAG